MYLSCGDQRSAPEDKSIFHDLMKREREKESKRRKNMSGMSFSILAKLTLWPWWVFFAQTVDYCMSAPDCCCGSCQGLGPRPFCCARHGFETLPPKNLAVPCLCVILGPYINVPGISRLPGWYCFISPMYPWLVHI